MVVLDFERCAVVSKGFWDSCVDTKQLSGQWFEAEHEMIICCFQCTSCKSDKVEIHLVSKKYFFSVMLLFKCMLGPST